MMTVLECVEQDAGVSFMYRLAAEQGIAPARSVSFRFAVFPCTMTSPWCGTG
jgi:hypothetical protein